MGVVVELRMRKDLTVESQSYKEVSSPLSEAVEQRDRESLNMVRHAIKAENVMLAFQPVVSARDTSRPAFYEGLIRIIDGTGRTIPASDFINAIETTEIGREIDRLALTFGLQTLAKVPGLRLSINMSARSIRNSEWMNALYRGLALDPTIGERLILEITESSAIDLPDVTCAFMDELQQQSICFALDDFGAGYTSFRYLRDFFFDVLKIDGSYIRGIHQDADSQAITQAMVTLAQHFEMLTVAEHVETPQDAEFLQRIGVDCLQGYLFGAPSTNPSWVPVSQDRRAI